MDFQILFAHKFDRGTTSLQRRSRDTLLRTRNRFSSALRAAFFLVAWILFFPVLAEAQAPERICTYRYSLQIKMIAGHEVEIESYRPEGKGPFPLVFMLHGSAGCSFWMSAE